MNAKQKTVGTIGLILIVGAFVLCAFHQWQDIGEHTKYRSPTVPELLNGWAVNTIVNSLNNIFCSPVGFVLTMLGLFLLYFGRGQQSRSAEAKQKDLRYAALVLLVIELGIIVAQTWRSAWEIDLLTPSGWPVLQLVRNFSIFSTNTLVTFFKHLVSLIGNLFIFMFSFAYFYYEFKAQKQSENKVKTAFLIFVALSVFATIGFYAYHSSIGKFYVLIFACEYIYCDFKTPKSSLFKLQSFYRLSARLAAVIAIVFNAYYFAYIPLKFHFVIERIELAQTTSEEKLAFQFAKAWAKPDRIWFAGDEMRFIQDKNKRDMRLALTWHNSSPFTHQQYQAHCVLIDIKNLDYLGYRKPAAFN